MAEASLPSIGDLHDDQIVALLRPVRTARC